MIDEVFQKIVDIIKSEFKNSFAGGKFVLQDSTSKPVIINKSGHCLCLQMDKRNTNIFPFFETSIEGLCKVADRIIIYPTAKSLFIFIIELKSSNTTDAFKQITATYELGKYICETAKRLLNYPNIDIRYRGLIFSHKTFKGTTKPKNLKYTKVKNINLEYMHRQSGGQVNLDTISF